VLARIPEIVQKINLRVVWVSFTQAAKGSVVGGISSCVIVRFTQR
jgi:hypothetical protein